MEIMRWSAPEILTGGKASKAADIFALAMVMVEECHEWIHRISILLTVALDLCRSSAEKNRLALSQIRRQLSKYLGAGVRRDQLT